MKNGEIYLVKKLGKSPRPMLVVGFEKEIYKAIPLTNSKPQNATIELSTDYGLPIVSYLTKNKVDLYQNELVSKIGELPPEKFNSIIGA